MLPAMRAIVIVQPGGPEVLQLRDVPDPQPAAAEVLVRVRATALNRADILQRKGHYPPPPSSPRDIPGLEFAGEVAALGPGATLWRVGQRVFGITGGGAYAQFLVAHERTLAEIPPNLSWSEAAAVPEAFITAHDALWKQAALRPSECVLIHAVGSGLGIAALQLVRAMAAVPFGTARTAEKLERARPLGLEDGVVLTASLEGLAPAVERWTGGRGCDVVFDLVGGPYVSASVRVLAPLGRLMIISSAAGASPEIDLRLVLSRRLTLRGSVLRARPLEEKILVTRAFAAQVVPLLALGAVRAVVDSEFPLDQAAAAHARMESNQTFGKVVLLVP